MRNPVRIALRNRAAVQFLRLLIVSVAIQEVGQEDHEGRRRPGLVQSLGQPIHHPLEVRRFGVVVRSQNHLKAQDGQHLGLSGVFGQSGAQRSSAGLTRPWRPKTPPEPS